jgi:integrase
VEGKLVRVEGDGWKEALELYKRQADDLHAGRTPRVAADGLTVATLCNHFLTAKTRKVEAGELTPRMFAEYKLMTDMVVSGFGATRLVDDVAADDFARLRATMTTRWGPLRVVNGVTRIKSIFKFGFEAGLMDRPARFGPEFAPPSRAVLRRHRAKSPPKMFEAEELRTLLAALEGRAVTVGEKTVQIEPEPQLRAMVLLGLNAGFGNGDCAALNLAAVELDKGWISFPRPKTGIGRRCPLWPETVAALRQVIDTRPAPKQFSDCGLVFLTYRGTAWVRMGDDSRSDYLSVHFNRLLKKLGLHRQGFGFYTLRHVFRTVADGARDNPAVRSIMGHADASIDAAYRERIEDERLKAVTDHVRAWLFGESAK